MYVIECRCKILGVCAEGFSDYQLLTVRELTQDNALDCWQNFIVLITLTSYWVNKSRRDCGTYEGNEKCSENLEGKCEGKILLGQHKCRGIKEITVWLRT